MIAFNLLQDFQIKFGLLTLEEEKQKIVPASSAQTGEFTGLGYQFVLVSPVSFSLNNNVLKALKDHQKDLSKLQKLPSVFDNEERFISKIEKALNITLDLPQKLHLLESAAHPNSLKTYWDALRIIAYHSFKNRHIIQKDGTLLPLKTKRQFDYFFHQNTTIDRIRYEDNDP
ncbi:hypothetical protein KKA14_01705 [bacterium]|nr:hypothetical protein [bacterium]